MQILQTLTLNHQGTIIEDKQTFTITKIGTKNCFTFYKITSTDPTFVSGEITIDKCNKMIYSITMKHQETDFIYHFNLEKIGKCCWRGLGSVPNGSYNLGITVKFL